METKIKRNYKELAKRNTFLAHAEQIKSIAVEKGVDVGVATDMYIADHDIALEEMTQAKKHEFLDYCKHDTLNAIVEELKK